MKNKLIFRILGALSSALIIVSVFVPFVKVTGYSQSLWQTNVNTLYLPIIIIVFGAIGVLLFATNLKTELAYSTTGALLFFLITQSIPIINQGTFSTLNVGYYFLVVGTLLTGVMTFLNGLKPKQKVIEEVKVEETKEDSMINQIDRLYENQAVQNNDTEINQVEMIQPLQSIQPLESVVQNNNSLNMPIEENETENLNDLLNPTIQTNIEEKTTIEQPIVEDTFEQPTVIEEKQEINNASNPVIAEFEAPKQEESVPPSNPVVSEFEVSMQETSTPVSNPVVSEFEVPKQEAPVQPTNSVVSEFAMPQVNEVNNNHPQPTISNNVVTEVSQPLVQSANPVTSEFGAPSQFGFGAPQSVEAPVENKSEEPQSIEPLQPLQPLGSDINKVDVMADPTTVKDNNSSNLDIFG